MLLKENEIVTFEDGTVCRVINRFNGGGQGDIYKVDLQGKLYVLKIYRADFINKLPKAAEFKKNLISNIEKGPISEKYVWPLKLTKTYPDGSYGYLMDFIPEGFVSFNKFIVSVTKGQTPSGYFFRGVAELSIRMVLEFMRFWNKGYCFQDLNEGSLFLNPKTWEIRICDCDNVAPDRTPVFIAGMPRYMAPEIVVGKDDPNYYSDLYSLSVILHMIFFGKHPLEGKATASLKIMPGPRYDKHFYGDKPVYLHDPKDDSNRPQKGVDDLFLFLYRFYPKYVKDLFLQCFTEGLFNAQKRPSGRDILIMLGRLNDDVMACPHCGSPSIPDVELEGTQPKCKKCGKDYFLPLYLQAKDIRIFIVPGSKVYKWHLKDRCPSTDDAFLVVGSIEKGPDGKKKILRNESSDPWTMTIGDKKTQVPPGRGCVLLQGLSIEIGNRVFEVK